MRRDTMIIDPIYRRLRWNLVVPYVFVLACAIALKLYYSEATPNQLRWILAPTAALVEWLSGLPFEFESQAGYINREHRFMIVASCSGVHFMMIAFLMLAMKWVDCAQTTHARWLSVPSSAAAAYLVTLVANALRISIALHLQKPQVAIWGLDAAQIHRLEGIVIYFGCLLLLSAVNEKVINWKTRSASVESSTIRKAFLPFIIYCTAVVVIPMANGAFRQGSNFWDHSLFVLMVPTAMVLVLTVTRFVLKHVLIILRRPDPRRLR